MYDNSTSLNKNSLNALPALCINKVPLSAPTGFIPSLDPLLVAPLITTLDGVIGSSVDCGKKYSAPFVKICKSLPENKAVIAFVLSVAIVASIASSSNPSPGLKSKNLATLDAKIVLGLDLDPPKYNLPSWKVTDLG